MAYTPYLIANHRYGTELSVEPWLAPVEAYTNLLNCYLRRGVITKRRGRELLGSMVHAAADEAIGALGSAAYAGTLDYANIRPFSVEITDSTLSLTDDGEGAFEGDGTGTINYDTGVYSVVFSGNTDDAVTASYTYTPTTMLPIVGIESHHDATAGTSDLIIFDTRRAAKYNETTKRLDPIGSADIWTSEDTHIIWGVNYQSSLFVCNNRDRVQVYNGSIFSDLLMDIDGDSNNDVDYCMVLIVYKERIVALRTTENGTFFPQRARWCKPGDPDDWTNDGYVDCPTSEWITAAGFIKDDLIVFFQYSTWRLRYTGDAELPFRWEKISGVDGAYAPYSGFNYLDKMGAVGETGINETDGLQVYSIDDRVPDAVAEMDQTEFGRTYSIVSPELKQVIISYPQIGSEENDKSWVYNYEDKSWSRYDFGFNVYGYYKVGQSGIILDDITELLDNIDYSFDDATLQAGFPTTIAGDLDGNIWTINTGSDDNGSNIPLEIMSGRWNPYTKNGRKSRLGWVDFLVDHSPSISFTVHFYVGHEFSPYESVTLTCGEAIPEVTDGKVWVRAYAGAEGEFHRMKISHSAIAQTLRIHAVMPYFKPTGIIK